MGSEADTVAEKNRRSHSGEEGFEDPSTLSKGSTRRDFVKAAGVGGGALGLFGLTSVRGTTAAPVLVPDAKMMIVHDPNRCVGCRRCEVACTLAHDSKIQPAISRIKLSRNYNFGPDGPRFGWTHGEGLYGNFRLVADTCLQCAHPVPCATTCPNGAIEVDPASNTRVINKSKCVGCGICTKACPWAMITVDKEAKKATKCDLCGGNPQCVAVCPAGAISYVAWRDRSKEIKPRQAVSAAIQPASGVAESCDTCHGSSPTISSK